MSVVSELSGWRLALRLAWREAWRAKGRSALVLVMVTLPVVAVVAADVAQATSSVSAVEGLDRTVGSSQALVTAVSRSPVVQLPDPSLGGFAMRGGSRGAPGQEQVQAALGGGRPLVEVRDRGLRVRTRLGVLDVGATATDLGDPLTAGLFRLTSGRFPTAVDEVAVNGALAGQGLGVGDRVTLGDGRVVTVVGTAESTSERTFPRLVGELGLLRSTGGQQQWLVGGGPVTWADVQALNEVGAIAVSRTVIEHPPSLDRLPPQLRWATAGTDAQVYTVLALIAVMTLLEVVLLAGPAFAVGARRQARTLALIAANGGTPRQSRRTILASAVVLGSVGALLGVVLGIAVGRAVVPLLQQHADQWFGPFQVRWDHVALVAAFGLLSALLAAVVPAWVASRQDVVAVLAGRRGDRRASLRWPFVGVGLLGLGVVLATMGARGSGDLLIAAAAVVSVFGMIFLVPVVVVVVARLGRRFPLPLRYAVRDAARHRTRTVPAVAAVAATVAGVVALAIGNTSDQAQQQADYSQQLPLGEGAVSGVPDRSWPAARTAVRDELPGVTATEILGTGGAGGREAVRFRAPGPQTYSYGYSSQFGVGTLVGAEALPLADLAGAELAQAQRALAQGGAVVMTSEPVDATTVRVRHGHGRPVTVPAAYADVGSSGTAPMMGIISPALATRLGLTSRPVGLLLHGAPISSAQQDALTQRLAAVSSRSTLYVEHGYQVPGSEQVVLWILFGLAGVLMLGGTLTATFLALSDARPDLATLSAVGAAPRARRGVAAAYALSVGAVGALLGAAVGFIPGIAVSYPLTRGFLPGAPSHYLDIPWTLILGLVVALPLVTALVVGLTARSRLPLVARLD